MFKNLFPFKKDITNDWDDLLLKLDEEQLRTLNRKVVERLKLMRRTQAAVSVAKFNLGERVSFKYQSGLIVGTVTRLNQKTVSILTDEQHKWNVSPGFLSKIIE